MCHLIHQPIPVIDRTGWTGQTVNRLASLFCLAARALQSITIGLRSSAMLFMGRELSLSRASAVHLVVMATERGATSVMRYYYFFHFYEPDD